MTITLNETSFTSKVVKKTLNPEWNEVRCPDAPMRLLIRQHPHIHVGYVPPDWSRVVLLLLPHQMCTVQASPSDESRMD